jgi:hypothetical protein
MFGGSLKDMVGFNTIGTQKKKLKKGYGSKWKPFFKPYDAWLKPFAAKNKYKAKIKYNNSAMAIAKYNQYKIAQMMKGKEKKYDQAVDTTMVIPVGGNWIVNGFGPYMIKGTGQSNRFAQQIQIKSLFMRFVIKLSAVEALGTTVRLVVFYDRDPNGGDADSGDLMLSDNQINSPYSIDKEIVGRFKILLDKNITFDTTKTQAHGKLYSKGPLIVNYNNLNAGDVTDVERGNFLIMAMALDNAATIGVKYSWRFTFTDS